VRLFAWAVDMAQGKIEPLIDAAEKRAIAKSQAEMRTLIDAIDTEINELQRQLDVKIEQIEQRLKKLEEGNEVSA
jgi:DNA-binding Lrp family transcriptional regulator